MRSNGVPISTETDDQPRISKYGLEFMKRQKQPPISYSVHSDHGHLGAKYKLGAGKPNCRREVSSVTYLSAGRL